MIWQIERFQRHPRGSAVVSLTCREELHYRMEKPVWAEGLQSKREACILPEPAQAVVQTRRLNEAWSWQLLWTDAVRWVRLPLSFFLLRDFHLNSRPASVLAFLNDNTVCACRSESCSHCQHVQKLCFSVSAWYKYMLWKCCNHIVDQQKELLLGGNVFRVLSSYFSINKWELRGKSSTRATI